MYLEIVKDSFLKYSKNLILAVPVLVWSILVMISAMFVGLLLLGSALFFLLPTQMSSTDLISSISVSPVMLSLAFLTILSVILLSTVYDSILYTMSMRVAQGKKVHLEKMLDYSKYWTKFLTFGLLQLLVLVTVLLISSLPIGVAVLISLMLGMSTQVSTAVGFLAVLPAFFLFLVLSLVYSAFFFFAKAIIVYHGTGPIETFNHCHELFRKKFRHVALSFATSSLVTFVLVIFVTVITTPVNILSFALPIVAPLALLARFIGPLLITPWKTVFACVAFKAKKH